MTSITVLTHISHLTRQSRITGKNLAWTSVGRAWGRGVCKGFGGAEARRARRNRAAACPSKARPARAASSAAPAWTEHCRESRAACGERPTVTLQTPRPHADNARPEPPQEACSTHYRIWPAPDLAQWLVCLISSASIFRIVRFPIFQPPFFIVLPSAARRRRISLGSAINGL